MSNIVPYLHCNKRDWRKHNVQDGPEVLVIQTFRANPDGVARPKYYYRETELCDSPALQVPPSLSRAADVVRAPLQATSLTQTRKDKNGNPTSVTLTVKESSTRRAPRNWKDARTRPQR